MVTHQDRCLMSEYDILEQHDPMPLMDVLEKVREGCEMHMNQLDNDGYCAESDEYVVALAFFEDYLEKIKAAEEKEAMREGEWDSDPLDHIEERERDAMLGQDEQFMRNGFAHHAPLTETLWIL